MLIGMSYYAAGSFPTACATAFPIGKKKKHKLRQRNKKPLSPGIHEQKQKEAAIAAPTRG